MTYFFAWKNNPKRQTLYKRRCRVIARGALNSVLIEFEGGQKECVSRHAVRIRTNAKSKINPPKPAI